MDESLRKAKQSLVRELLAEDDEAIFSESICALGLEEGSAAWEEAMTAWQDAKRDTCKDVAGGVDFLDLFHGWQARQVIAYRTG